MTSDIATSTAICQGTSSSDRLLAPTSIRLTANTTTASAPSTTSIGSERHQPRIRDAIPSRSSMTATVLIATRQVICRATDSRPPALGGDEHSGEPLASELGSESQSRTGRLVSSDSIAARPATSGTRASWPLTAGGTPERTLSTKDSHCRMKLNS